MGVGVGVGVGLHYIGRSQSEFHIQPSMAIPERDFFTLEEIVHRWRFAGMDSATLLKLASDDLLVFSIYIREIGSHTATRETQIGAVTRTRQVQFSFKAQGYSRPVIQYLKSDDARRILEARPGEKIAVRGHYSFPKRTKESGLGHATAPLFTRDDLVVSKVERDRFEKKHKVALSPPWYYRVWAWLSDQANHRVLTMLSGWVAALVTAAWAAWVWWHQQPECSPTATPNSSIESTSPRNPGDASYVKRWASLPPVDKH